MQAATHAGPSNGDLITRHRESCPPRSDKTSHNDVPINERIIVINAEQSALYLKDEPARRRHWAKHPTHFACLKCMDGRVHLPSATKTPMGLVKPFRGIGGRFEAFWPSFIDRLEAWADKATARGARCFVFVSYHYSRSNPHLGCKGWKCDTTAALAHSERLCRDLVEIFGDEMYAVPLGVETDTDAFTLHGPRGTLSAERLIGLDEDDVRVEVRRILPEIDAQTLRDLMPFLMGNAERVLELRETPRPPAELGHRERVIALGQGFDWLAQANFAIINNDHDPNLDEAVTTAAEIVEANLANAPPGDDATLFTNVTYGHPGKDYRKAVARARGLQTFAQSFIRERRPRLVASGRLRYLVGVTFEPSKELKVIEQGTVA